jgi:hypothetical protein
MAAQQHGMMQGRVLEPSIHLYEQALDDLAACGENIDQYRLANVTDGDLPSVMHAGELQARVMAVLGYFTIRDAVLDQANQTGQALQTLIGFETPQRG